MRSMGIDPSTRCGVVVLESNEDDPTRPRVLCEEEITTPDRGLRGAEKIAKGVIRLSREFEPAVRVIEGYALARPMRMVDMVEIGTMIRHFLDYFATDRSGPNARLVRAYLVTAPSQLKKFATGNGNAKKERVGLAVLRRWGHEPATHNTADALVCAAIGLAVRGKLGPLDRQQQEAIDNLGGR